MVMLTTRPVLRGMADAEDTNLLTSDSVYRYVLGA